jgi:hypothetical protein
MAFKKRWLLNVKSARISCAQQMGLTYEPERNGCKWDAFRSNLWRLSTVTHPMNPRRMQMTSLNNYNCDYHFPKIGYRSPGLRVEPSRTP